MKKINNLIFVLLTTICLMSCNTVISTNINDYEEQIADEFKMALASLQAGYIIGLTGDEESEEALHTLSEEIDQYVSQSNGQMLYREALEQCARHDEFANNFLEIYNDIKVSFSTPEPLADRGSIKRWKIVEKNSYITFEFSIDTSQGNYDLLITDKEYKDYFARELDL